MKKILSLVLALVMIFAMATTAFAADNYTNDASFTITTSASDASGAVNSETPYTWNIDVTAGLQADTVTEAEVAANYYVIVSWDVTSDLVYKIGKDAYSWNVYSNMADKTDAATGNAVGAGYEVDYSKGYWEGSATVKVTVTNWSNRTVTANIAFDPAEKNEEGVAENIVMKGTWISAETLSLDAASKGVTVADSNLTEYAESAVTTKAAQAESTVTLDASTIEEGGIYEADAVIGTVTVTLVGLETPSVSAQAQATVNP